MEPEGFNSSQEDDEVRKGPWTTEEDFILMNHIANHGEGVWNSLAKAAGLKRTGKSCRLRWLNYLRPDVRRGNITPEEQFLIMDLHSKWGNRWSKIARQLPGRTDNEIKNYWRTRIQKHFKQQQQRAESVVHGQMMGSCSEMNDDRSISTSAQISSFDDIAEPMEISLNSPPSSHGYMEAISYEQQQTLGSADEVADYNWSHMEELWSMQLLN